MLPTKLRSMHVKISDNTWKCKSQNELSVQHENGDYCRNGPVLGANCFCLASGAAHICEYMSLRFR